MSRTQLPASSPNGKLMTAEERFLHLKKDLHQQLITGMDLSTIGTMNEEELRVEVRRAAEELCRQSARPAQPERARAAGQRGDRRDVRPGSARALDARPDDPRHPGQRSQDGLRRAERPAGAGQRRRSTTSGTCSRSSSGSSAGSAGGSTRPPRWSMPGWPTAAASTRSFRRWPWTARSCRFAASAPGRLLIKDLVANKAITPEMVSFLSACIQARINVIISGGTGSGKTTLLNALSSYIHHDERVATIEDAAELRLQQPHVVRMETRPANIEGEGEVTTRDLVRNALRMRPDRIIIGECRGPEALDMLQAMNTGHDGSMTTIHANDTRDALSRLEMMVGMAGFDLPIWIIRRQIASAHPDRHSDGPPLRRRPQGNQDLRDHRHGGRGHQHAGHLRLQADRRRRQPDGPGLLLRSGIRPQCMEKLEVSGNRQPVEMFERRILNV